MSHSSTAAPYSAACSHPRTVANTDHDDSYRPQESMICISPIQGDLRPRTERAKRCSDDCLRSIAVVRHLAVRNDDQNVVGLRLTHERDGCVDHRRKVGRSGKHELRRKLLVSLESVREARACVTVLIKREHGLVAGPRVAEAKSWDEVVVVKGRERAADDGDDALQSAALEGS